MTYGIITSDIEMAKHGCEDRYTALVEKIFIEKYAGKSCIILDAKPPEYYGYTNWQCGTDVVFHCKLNLNDIICATLCRHQLIIGD